MEMELDLDEATEQVLFDFVKLLTAGRWVRVIQTGGDVYQADIGNVRFLYYYSLHERPQAILYMKEMVKLEDGKSMWLGKYILSVERTKWDRLCTAEAA